MNKRKISTRESFRTAVLKLLEKRGRGAQGELAKFLGVTRQQFNDMCHGRRRVPDGTKDKVAEFFGFPVSQILFMGDYYLRSGIFFPYHQEVHHLEIHSKERAEKIYRLAGEEVGFGSTQMFKSDALRAWNAPGYIEYIEGEIEDGQLYATALKTAKNILKPE